jgi:predicted negative regulator of RcsB-dependent stress response
MAAFDLEEQERLDALKDWWKQNGAYVYVGLAAFIIAIAGVQGWRYYQAQRGDQAAELYAEFDKTVQGGDAKKTRAAATKLQEQYPGSLQAAEAALVAARQAYEGNDAAGAEASLRWVIDKSASSQFQHIARLRLAAVLFDQKKYDDALKLLDANKDEAFASLTADLKGDIYFAQAKLPEARASYKLALEKAPANAPSRQLIQVKLDTLGEVK